MTLNELHKIENTMMNYKLTVKLYGCMTIKEDIHVGLKGNHAEIITRLMNEKYGMAWKFVSISKKRGKFNFGVGQDYQWSEG